MMLAKGTRVGSYVLLEKLGEGSRLTGLVRLAARERQRHPDHHPLHAQLGHQPTEPGEPTT